MSEKRHQQNWLENIPANNDSYELSANYYAQLIERARAELTDESISQETRREAQEDIQLYTERYQQLGGNDPEVLGLNIQKPRTLKGILRTIIK
ncbi:MAG TPA: hypothetical protein VFS65_00360 [Candidatus Saccharimonadales bacterium]|nr:hypothetical protein [Candidatus Saccharimonadales bacterium]